VTARDLGFLLSILRRMGASRIRIRSFFGLVVDVRVRFGELADEEEERELIGFASLPEEIEDEDVDGAIC